MFVITQHFRRPGPEVTFYQFSSSYKSYLQSTYRDTNKLLSTDVNFNAIDKVLIVVNCWASEAEHIAYKQDPVVIATLAERESYNTANGITMSLRRTHEEADSV